MDIREINKLEGMSIYHKAVAKTTTNSPYYATGDEDVIIAVADTGDLIIILPQESSVTEYKDLRIINNSVGDNRVIIRTFLGDLFRYGNTEFVIPPNKAEFVVGLYEHGHHLLTEMSCDLRMMKSNWGASNFTSLTNIPYTAVSNNQPEFYEITAPGYVKILTTGNYDVSTMFEIDSTGGFTWNIQTRLYVNDLEVPFSRMATGNYGNEDNSMTGIIWGLELETDDIVDMRIRNTTLTGELLFTSFQLRLIVG